ncbi:MAG: GtrA family protein [Chloroflexi bacterium]|nr:GtrA family protein [Chloroflexota bacterium]MCL5109315.1 GtrA family protein [Chloroflexota bacterium]
MSRSAITVERFLKFALVGISGLLVNTGVLYLGHEVGGLPLVLASALAVETAIVNNYLWNNLWTFSRRSFTIRQFFRFNLVSLGGLVISVALLYAFVQFFGLYYLAANLLAVGMTTGWNFLLNALWAWGSAV